MPAIALTPTAMRTETATAPPYPSWRLTHPLLTAGLMVATTGAAVLQRDVVPAALLSGVVAGFALSGSV